MINQSLYLTKSKHCKLAQRKLLIINQLIVVCWQRINPSWTVAHFIMFSQWRNPNSLSQWLNPVHIGFVNEQYSAVPGESCHADHRQRLSQLCNCVSPRHLPPVENSHLCPTDVDWTMGLCGLWNACREHHKTPRSLCWFSWSQPSRWQLKFGDRNSTSMNKEDNALHSNGAIHSHRSPWPWRLKGTLTLKNIPFKMNIYVK